MRKRYAIASLVALCVLLSGCGGEKPEPAEETAVPVETPAPTAEETAVPVEAPAPTAEGYDVLGGTWAVGGIQLQGKLYDIHDNDALEDLYDTTFLTFNEDGTFVYFNVTYGYRGTYAPHGEDGYLLTAESSFNYKMERGELAREETPLEKKVQYLVTLKAYAYGDNIFELHGYDALMGKAKVEEMLLLFEPEDGESGYIDNNKTPLKEESEESEDLQSGQVPAEESAPTHSASTTHREAEALEKAKDYLDVMAFSYKGLIDQLEYEGFTHAEATYGADHCGADWMEQAAEKAKDYRNLMAFSRQGLIDQLEYEGFTYEQAVYGADHS